MAEAHSYTQGQTEKPAETTILAVERALMLIEHLAAAYEGEGLAAIARMLDVNKSIALRLLETLEKSGYVWRDDNAQRYHLTYRVSNLGLRQLQISGLLGQCSSVLEDLAADTGELVRLAVVERGERITWVYAAAGRRGSLRIDPTFNFEVSLHTHATGKAWLMAMPQARAVSMLERSGMTALTPHSGTDLDALLRELEFASTRGFASTYEENEIGVGAVAAPIVAARLEGERECVGAVSVAAPTNRMTRTQIEACGPMAAEAASRLAMMWPLDERVSISSYP